MSAQSRLQSTYMWRMITFLLEGLIFLLVGIELPLAFEGLGNHSLQALVLYAVLVSATAIVVRLLWVYPGALFARFIRNPLGNRAPQPPWQNIVFLGLAGIRGGDSLVIALSLPLETKAGTAFPGRAIIIFLTFVVIVVTLVVLGLSLAPVVRRLGLQGDDEDEREEALRRGSELLRRGPRSARGEPLRSRRVRPLGAQRRLRATHGAH